MLNFKTKMGPPINNPEALLEFWFGSWWQVFGEAAVKELESDTATIGVN